jgi:hypothetical protein
MLNAKNAVTLGIGIPANGSLVGKYGIKESDVPKAEFNSMHIRAAYRHYSGNLGLPKGFYIEPYLKYQKVKANVTASFSNNQTDASYPADLKADFHTLNAGFQIGLQWLIAKRVAIDFYFLGLEAGLVGGNFSGTPSNASNVADLRTKIEGDPQTGKDGIQELPGFLKDKLTVTSNSTSVNVKASSIPYPWLRSRISVGIAF